MSRRALGSPAVGLLALIGALDLLSWLVADSIAEIGFFDVPAHLLTAVLALLALATARRSPLPPAFILAALIASVAIDLDHVPAYLGWNGLSEGMPRPLTHSVGTVALLAAIALVSPPRVGEWALGAAFGVAVHLGRDLATGSGVVLFWPWRAELSLPYPLLAAAMSALAAFIVLRPGRPTDPRPLST